MSNSLITITVLISVFSALLVSSILILVYLHIYKKIRQYLANSLDLIEYMKKSPLKHRIQRVAIIKEMSNLLGDELMIWRTQYEVYFEKYLRDIFAKLTTILENKKFVTPNIKNLKRFKFIYEKLTEYNNKVYAELNEIDLFFTEEHLQRDYITSLKKIFTHVKEEFIKMLFHKQDAIDSNKLKNYLESIENLFIEFYIAIDEGRYLQSVEFIEKISIGLDYLISLLDAIPSIVSKVENVIPEKMSEIKNEYVTFGKEARLNLTANGSLFFSLERYIDENRIKVKHQIFNLQYIKAKRTLKSISNEINEFVKKVEYESSIKEWFKRNESNLRQLFNTINSIILKIEKAANQVYESKVTSMKEKNEIVKLTRSYTPVKNDLDLTLSKLIRLEQKTVTNYLDIKKSVLSSLDKIFKILNALEPYTKMLDSEKINKDECSVRVSVLRSKLQQMRNRIDQYSSIPELAKYHKDIKLLDDELIILENFPLDDKNPESLIIFNNNMMIMEDKTNDLIRQFNDSIFLDYISQELIIYMERFVAGNHAIVNTINKLEELFEKRDLNQLVGISLKTLISEKQSR